METQEIPKCQVWVSDIEKKTGEMCSGKAVLRVKIYDETYDEGEEFDVCKNHVDGVGAEYPDCIETIKRYEGD